VGDGSYDSFKKEKETEFYESLKNNARVQEWLSKFNEHSRDSFLKRYAKEKVNIILFQNYYREKSNEVKELKYREHTETALNLILEKKYFNLQLLWRAEKIVIPEIRTSWDFKLWENQLKTCPFLEPISRQEIEVMKMYLQSDSCELAGDEDNVNHLNFEELLEKDEQDDFHNLPPWYEFYDNKMGTGYLMNLPNIRIPKEEYYHGLCIDKRRGNIPKQPEPEYPPTLPFLMFLDYEKMYELAKENEDEIFTECFRVIYEQKKEREAIEKYERNIENIYPQLLSMKNLPPVRGGISWREALYFCYLDYIHSVIYDEIDIVYDEYLMYKELDLNTEKENFRSNSWKELNEQYLNMILEGREIAGEPRDLNF
jgi:hypothetical protein